ncbi:MAG: sugar-binding transcriptional regulator, partial [Ancalomicrobiaceae bacterium]|nr:sugar-binding transcriptional regulator [Ancalomicrobiaceae bacterium]
MPLRYGDDPYVWACWLYYEDGLTQSEVADAMGVSRATVNTYLAEARDRGIINIALEPSRLAALTIADDLKRHFGLLDCLVVPSDESRPLIDRLGTAGALAMRTILQSGDRLAVAWGRTVMAVAERLAASPLQSLTDMTVVQATGSMPPTITCTPDLCTAAFGRALLARCVNIAAPAIVGSPDLVGYLMDEPLIASAFAALANVNRIIFGISSLRSNSTIHASGFFESVSLQHYLARGAVGVLAGRFIDERGAAVEGPLDARTIGIQLDVLASIRTRIAVAGGFDKVPAILALLRGGFANVLITDAATGRGILNADGVKATRSRGETAPRAPIPTKMHIKKFLNR